MSVLGAQQPWPILRDDLQLLPGQAENGHPTWTIYDPAALRYIKLPWYDIEALKRWHLGSPDAIAAALTRETTLQTTPQEVEILKDFLVKARLIAPTTPTSSHLFAQILEHKKSGILSWLLHHYLFVSISLCNPDNTLGWVERHTKWITAWRLWTFLLSNAALVLVLISQQWDTFVQDARELWSWQGALIVSGAIFVAKAFHELGHGLAAKRYGCRVPAMGLALLVMCPILWTNTTNAWRLTKRHERIAIDAGGVTAELLLGVFAAWLWLFLPDGSAKEAALALAASTWILAVTVNFNPLMRFDGYYITSDLLHIENMQERTFAYARWRLRTIIFGPLKTDPEPGHLPPHKHAIALLYAYATWVYRFFLFMGIALLVYKATFKALGFVLMATEIGCFLALPIVKELRSWRKRFLQSRLQRKIILLGIILCFLLLFVTPWNTKIRLPAVAQAAQQERLYSRDFGVVRFMLPNGSTVQAGTIILRLESQRVERDILSAQADMAYWHDKATQAARSNETQSTSVSAEQAHYKTALASLQKALRRRENLIVRAPFPGILHDVPPELKVGLLIPRQAEIGLIIDQSHTRFIAYAHQNDINPLKVQQSATFFPQDGQHFASARVISLALFPTENLETHVLWNGGKGPLRGKIEGHQLKPERTLYRVEANGTQTLGQGMEIPGYLVVQGNASSFAAILYRRAVSVFRMEANL
ncbi:hypothetical protein NKW53_12435 [Acetobacter orientalis]|uniref:hypothetical protein n=1 Tax=Acetobacter orientalis TaxID=146474 RepID=UPI0020A03713|nr:hypothetical protein [Acetobacter orientalis]MCP1216873.1 hypothetical protein [Acetobacter orientalis]MCP1219780.1 hypothetical protein [Acetobacter orientalis]